MGCFSPSSVTTISRPKLFHEMSEEEKEKIKKKLEERDKNIEDKLENPKTSYKNFNRDDMEKKLPVGKTKEERTERLKLWENLNESVDSYMSYNRLNVQLTNYLDLPQILRNKGPVKLAFDAASDKYLRNGIRKEDNLIEWIEFRIFLVYLRQYFDYWFELQKVDDSGEHKISLDEFKNAIPLMNKYGLEIKDYEAEKEFNNLKGGDEDTISFEEFCEFAIQKSIELDDDDNFDDEELQNLK